jgi:hypothetical protein
MSLDIKTNNKLCQFIALFPLYKLATNPLSPTYSKSNHYNIFNILNFHKLFRKSLFKYNR